MWQGFSHAEPAPRRLDSVTMSRREIVVMLRYKFPQLAGRRVGAVTTHAMLLLKALLYSITTRRWQKLPQADVDGGRTLTQVRQVRWQKHGESADGETAGRRG